MIDWTKPVRFIGNREKVCQYRNGDGEWSLRSKNGSFICYCKLDGKIGGIQIVENYEDWALWGPDDVQNSLYKLRNPPQQNINTPLFGTVKVVHINGVSIHGFGLKTWAELAEHFLYKSGDEWRPCRKNA